jgi:hypothetical protein
MTSLDDPTIVDQAESAPVLPSSPVMLLPMASEVGAQIVQEPSMGVASTSLPAPSPGADAGHFMYDARLEEVLKALDPAHRLAELTSSWKELLTTFGEKLQVNISMILFFKLKVFFSFFSHSFSLKACERDHSDFFGSSEVEKRLSIEVGTLKAKLASKTSELDSVRQEQ